MTDQGTLIACIALAFFAAFYLLLPYIRSASGVIIQVPAGELELTLGRKARCLQVLRDLELDFVTGKLEEQDYLQMKASVASEFVEIRDRLKELENG